MDTLTIPLPEPLRAFVEERAARDGYATPADYVRALIDAEQRRQAAERLDALLLEGLDSGEPLATPPDYLETKKRELVERFARPARDA